MKNNLKSFVSFFKSRRVLKSFKLDEKNREDTGKCLEET